MRQRRTWLIAAVLIAAVATGVIGYFLGAAQRQAPREKLVVAIQPTVASSEMLEKAQPLRQFLQQRLGSKVDVEVYVPMSYAAVVESLRFGHADVAFMSAWPAQLAVELAEADLALAEVREVIHGTDKVEAAYYYSYWVVPATSPYQRLQELKGKRACFPSPISTSGYVAPLGRLTELGLLSRPEKAEADPKAFFGEVLFGGGYGQCWAALKQGQVDVTVIAGDVPENLYQEVLANTRTLEQQGPIPSHGVLLSKDLKEPLRSQVIQAIMDLGAPEHRTLMRSFISSIFVRFQPTTASQHLEGLRRSLALAGLRYTERIGP